MFDIGEPEWSLLLSLPYFRVRTEMTCLACCLSLQTCLHQFTCSLRSSTDCHPLTSVSCECCQDVGSATVAAHVHLAGRGCAHCQRKYRAMVAVVYKYAACVTTWCSLH